MCLFPTEIINFTSIMRKLLLLLTMTIAAVCTMSAQKFTGKIGEFDVTLYADFSNASEGDSIGYYYYNDRPKTKFKLVLVECEDLDIALRRYVIKEYTPKGNNTGKFVGRHSTKWDSFSGKFTNSRGKEYDFEFMFLENLDK